MNLEVGKLEKLNKVSKVGSSREQDKPEVMLEVAGVRFNGRRRKEILDVLMNRKAKVSSGS